MNYLAHLVLAAPNKKLMAGGFVGDFVKGSVDQVTDTGLADGIRLHRAIDAFSDQHPSLKQLREQLPDHWRRFAGVLLDMMTDHYLAANWQSHRGSKLKSKDLQSFARQTTSLLRSYDSMMPDQAAHVLGYIERHQWLVNYADLDFTLRAIEGIGRRMRFENPLNRCRELLPQYQKNFFEASHWLYTDSVKHVAEWCRVNLDV